MGATARRELISQDLPPGHRLSRQSMRRSSRIKSTIHFVDTSMQLADQETKAISAHVMCLSSGSPIPSRWNMNSRTLSLLYNHQEALRSKPRRRNHKRSSCIWVTRYAASECQANAMFSMIRQRLAFGRLLTSQELFNCAFTYCNFASRLRDFILPFGLRIEELDIGGPRIWVRPRTFVDATPSCGTESNYGKDSWPRLISGILNIVFPISEPLLSG